MYAKKNRRTGLVVLLVLLMLLIGVAAGGTIAWLMTSTEPLVNTFAPAGIDIVLNEDFTPNSTTMIGGEAVPAAKLIPGCATTKAPRVTVKEGSAKCYVRLFTVVWWDLSADYVFDGAEAAAWFQGADADFPQSVLKTDSYIDKTSNEVVGFVFEVQYKEVDASNGDVTLPAPFTKINVPKEVNPDELKTLDKCQIFVFAQAVQSEGFAGADAAFAEVGYPNISMTMIDGKTRTLEQMINTLKEQPAYKGNDSNTDGGAVNEGNQG